MSDTNVNVPEAKTKNLTLRNVLGWVLGIVIGVPGIMMLFEKPLMAGVFILLSALIIFPPVRLFLKKKAHISFSTGLTVFLFLVLLIVGTAIKVGGESHASNVSITPTVASSVPSVPASVPVTLLSESGSGTKSTKTFTVPGDWTLSWNYDCSNFGGLQGNFQVMIYNSDGSLSFENAPVNELGKSGSDTEYYHSGGSYYLEVNSECNWNLNVKG